MKKQEEITLIDYRKKWGRDESEPFYVESMKNTIQYNAGSCLSAVTVQELINIGWKVNIKTPKA